MTRLTDVFATAQEVAELRDTYVVCGKFVVDVC